ncbi:MAG TPA: class I adenylate-forming enzyme family protein, partial [Acidimicrobiales bacterium]|nr:class I adenylate-forming enzyme family protein [Acidimicrobiales bacterium]
MQELPARIRGVLEIDPGAPALEFEGITRPWSFLAGAVAELDERLTALGLGEGTPVGIVVRNRPDSVGAIIAVLGTSRCVVTLSSAIPPTALAEDIRSLALPVVVMGDRDWGAEGVVTAVVDAGGVAVRVSAGGLFVAETEGAARRSTVRTMPGVAVQMLTSGTTGPPKRIDLCYRSLEHEFESTAAYSPTADVGSVRLRSGTSILWAPLLHIGGMRGLISSVVSGRRMALLERFDVEAWRRLVVEHRPPVVSLAPTALRMVLDAGVPVETFESVRAVFAGTAPLVPEVADEFRDRYGVPVLVVYGATEFAGGVAGWTLRDWEQYGETKRGSVGRANAGIRVRIVDPDSGQPAGSGPPGVLEVMGPQLGTDDWVRTTDLARMDDDGFIWILGRADDVIIRGGFKISTTKVRDALVGHPDVADASVVGVPDARLGQVPVAAVEAKPGASLSAEGLEAFLR